MKRVAGFDRWRDVGLVLAWALMFATGTCSAAGDPCRFVMEVNDSMQFAQTEMRVGANCPVIEVNLRHHGQLPKASMGRNWVLAHPEDVLGIAVDGMAAGPDQDYLQPGDERVLARTAMIGPGEQASVRFSPRALTPGVEYRYFCNFPGHWAVMTGRLVVEP